MRIEIENRKIQDYNRKITNICKIVCVNFIGFLIISLIVFFNLNGTIEHYSYANMRETDVPFSFSQNLADISCNKMSCFIPMNLISSLPPWIKKIYICEKYNCSVENKTTTCTCDNYSSKISFNTN